VTAPPLNSWHHIALTRSGSAFRAFIDGTLVATDTGIVATLGGVLEITGQNANGDNGDLNGYIDELRVVKGVAVWTSDFTPPTAPYTAADLLPPDGGALDAPAIPDGGTSGYGIPGQSCNGMTGTECNGESCCKSISVPAGTFPMGRGTETCSSCTAGCPSGMTCDLDETPEHDVTVSAFSLDKYEVTVGRFRRFVDAYDRMNAPPALDTGANPNIPGSGWREAWNGSMPADGAALKIALSCDSGYETWSEIPGSGETRAINCVSWYMAMAFCIWDGGRLPTEAEWEYVAVGGSNNDIFPWGSTPMPTCELANGPGCAGAVTSVGSYPSGSGRWGHMDLAGNVWEWALDSYSASWYSLGPVPCVDCANLSTSLSTRINRGAAFSYGNIPSWLRGASRHDNDPTLRNLSTGVRCARSP
jgi:formylglycine-generating enzyme required for sulfatase activity